MPAPKKTQQIDVFGDTLSIMNGQAWKKKKKDPDGGNSSGQWSHLLTCWIRLDSTHSLGKSPSWNHHQKTLFKPLPAPHLLHHLRHLEKRLLDEWCFGSCCFFFEMFYRFQIWKTQKKGYEKALNLTKSKSMKRLFYGWNVWIFTPLNHWFTRHWTGVSYVISSIDMSILGVHYWAKARESSHWYYLTIIVGGVMSKIYEDASANPVQFHLEQMLSSVWNLSLQDLSPPDLGSTATVIFQLLGPPSVARHPTTSPKRSGGHLQLLHLCPIRRQIYAAERVYQATCKIGSTQLLRLILSSIPRVRSIKFQVNASVISCILWLFWDLTYFPETSALLWFHRHAWWHTLPTTSTDETPKKYCLKLVVVATLEQQLLLLFLLLLLVVVVAVVVVVVVHSTLLVVAYLHRTCYTLFLSISCEEESWRVRESVWDKTLKTNHISWVQVNWTRWWFQPSS